MPVLRLTRTDERDAIVAAFLKALAESLVEDDNGEEEHRLFTKLREDFGGDYTAANAYVHWYLHRRRHEVRLDWEKKGCPSSWLQYDQP